MISVKFDPAGGPITARATFLGKMVTNYEIFIRERNSNAQNTLLHGDNMNPEDDKVILQAPAAAHEGRRLVLETGFYGTDVPNHPNYEISFEVYQGDKLLGKGHDKDVLTGKAQYSLIFLKLEQ